MMEEKKELFDILKEETEEFLISLKECGSCALDGITATAVPCCGEHVAGKDSGDVTNDPESQAEGPPEPLDE